VTDRRAAQWAWALTAWANHAFITTVLVGLFPIFFDKYWAVSLPGTTSTFYLGLTNSGASFIVMLTAPWLGTLADQHGRKKRWFGLCTLLGALATALLAGIGAGHWLLALVMFGLASLGFWAGSSFQDALIVQVAESAESNRVSALGFALGYLGGGVLFAFNVLMVQHPSWFHLANAAAATRVAFLDVAVWWIIFTLPMFRYVSEAAPTDALAGWRELWTTIRSVLHDKPVLNFLLAYWLYIDGISTVQIMASDFGIKLGFSTNTLIQALLLVQFIAWPSAVLFGRLGRSHRRQARDLSGPGGIPGGHRLCLFHALGMAILRPGRHRRHRAGRCAGIVAFVLRRPDTARARGRVLRLLQHAGKVRRGSRSAGHGRGGDRDRKSAALDPGTDAVLRARGVAALARAGRCARRAQRGIRAVNRRTARRKCCSCTELQCRP
jgi:MFS family permease